MTRLLVTAASTGKQLGWAESDGATVTFSSPDIQQMFRPGRNGKSVIEVFDNYAQGWSNGYLVIAARPSE